MSLLDFFDEAPQAPSKDVRAELDIIIKKHGLTPPAALLEELNSLYLDPPPWQPWS